jgi:hypothetical protein
MNQAKRAISKLMLRAEPMIKTLRSTSLMFSVNKTLCESEKNKISEYFRKNADFVQPIKRRSIKIHNANEEWWRMTQKSRVLEEIIRVRKVETSGMGDQCEWIICISGLNNDRGMKQSILSTL